MIGSLAIEKKNLRFNCRWPTTEIRFKLSSIILNFNKLVAVLSYYKE